MEDSTSSYIAKLVWTSSDPGAAKLYGLTNDSHIREILMKEYIYLKAGIAYRLVYQAANDNVGSADIIMRAAVDELKPVFENSPDYLTYGGNWQELIDRIGSYRETVYSRELDGVRLKFLGFLNDQIGAVAIALFSSDVKLPKFVEEVEYDMWSKLMRRQKEKMGGCGCLSVVACVSILTVALLVFMVL